MVNLTSTHGTYEHGNHDLHLCPAAKTISEACVVLTAWKMCAVRGWTPELVAPTPVGQCLSEVGKNPISKGVTAGHAMFAIERMTCNSQAISTDHNKTISGGNLQLVLPATRSLAAAVRRTHCALRAPAAPYSTRITGKQTGCEGGQKTQFPQPRGDHSQRYSPDYRPSSPNT